MAATKARRTETPEQTVERWAAGSVQGFGYAARLYGPDARWVSWSRATAETKRLARRADSAGLPVARPLGHQP